MAFGSVVQESHGIYDGGVGVGHDLASPGPHGGGRVRPGPTGLPHAPFGWSCLAGNSLSSV
eukprot:187779-Alexandrium_andersonii.AAC.1